MMGPAHFDGWRVMGNRTPCETICNPDVVPRVGIADPSATRDGLLHGSDTVAGGIA